MYSGLSILFFSLLLAAINLSGFNGEGPILSGPILSGSDQAILLKFSINPTKSNYFEGLNGHFGIKIDCLSLYPGSFLVNYLITSNTCPGPTPIHRFRFADSRSLRDSSPLLHS